MKVKSLNILLIAVSFPLLSLTQNINKNYRDAFNKLLCMKQGKCSLVFKDAVFITENVYFDNNLSPVSFYGKIYELNKYVEGKIQANKKYFIHPFSDSNEILIGSSIYYTLKDTLKMWMPDSSIKNIPPYEYDFEDIWGAKDWSQMFVTKLLNEKTGNCHSLPFLFKILCDEFGIDSHLALAPSHYYIKQKSEKTGWFNVELTSGGFPMDAWIMASGYVHLDAIVNKVYMEALNDKQSISLCLIDLAKGYQRKLGVNADKSFIAEICDSALNGYPHFINALLLKAETTKELFDIEMKKYGAKHTSEILTLENPKKLFQAMTVLYNKIHELGYRRMPDDMYLSWLTSLKEEREKYESKKVNY